MDKVKTAHGDRFRKNALAWTRGRFCYTRANNKLGLLPLPVVYTLEVNWLPGPGPEIAIRFEDGPLKGQEKEYNTEAGFLSLWQWEYWAEDRAREEGFPENPHGRLRKHE